MKVEPMFIEGVTVVTPKKFEDDRGYFSETYQFAAFAKAGIEAAFLQDNLSKSKQAFTLRGLHYQSAPHAQSKLVRVVSGRIIDVVVDARAGSRTFGKWLRAELSSDGGEQIFVPKGCLHGFLTLEPDTIVAYKVDAYYHRPSDGSVIWNDNQIGIDWKLPDGQEPILSEKDAKAQSWSQFLAN